MPIGDDCRGNIFNLSAILEIMAKGIGFDYVAGLVIMVFAGIIMVSCLSNQVLMSELTALNQHVGLAVNSARFKLMDTLSPHIGSFYFWIPFYCALILLMVGFDKVRFRLNCFCVVAYLLIAGAGAVLVNLIASKYLADPISQFHYRYTGSVQLDNSFICLRATLAFGLAVFAMIFLNRRFNLIKIALLMFSLVLIYNLIYLGNDLPETLVLGMIAGTLAAILCSTWFRNLFKEHNNNYLSNLINSNLR
jgi:hypothetical protein